MKDTLNMPESVSLPNVALIGGGDLCVEILNKTASKFREAEVEINFCAVAEPDPTAKGMALARELGLKTFEDFHGLYDPRHGIDMIIITVPGQDLLKEVLQTRPDRIRIVSYGVFQLIRRAIGIEEEKLRKRNEDFET